MRTIFVTGSVKGLGKEIARHFIESGERVIIHYNTSEELAKEFYSESKSINDNVLLVHGDLTDEDQVKKIFQEIKQSFGKLDVLINNVGSFLYKPLNETEFSDFKNVIETNLYSVFLCSKEAIKIMNDSGHIINIGCISCDKSFIGKNTTPYYISKNGVYLLTRLMAKEFGVRVNMVSPGILENSVVKISDKYCEYRDIINVIEFLLSEKSKKITGANIEVSSGWSPSLF